MRVNDMRRFQKGREYYYVEIDVWCDIEGFEAHEMDFKVVGLFGSCERGRGGKP